MLFQEKQLLQGVGGRIVSFLIFLFPALTLAVRGGVNTSYFLLLLISIFFFFNPSNEHKKWPGEFGLALIFYPATIIVENLIHSQWNWPAFDSPSRFLLGIPLLVVLPFFSVNYLKSFKTGCLVGAITSPILIYYSMHHGAIYGVRTADTFVNPIPFSCIVLILGLCSLSFDSRQLRMKLLSGVAFISVLFASYHTESRAALIYVPVALVIMFYHGNNLRLRTKFQLIALSLSLLLLAYLSSAIIKNRIDLAFIQLIQAIHASPQNTSIGIRYQLWHAAWQLFLQHPLLGVGKGNFHTAIQGLVSSGMLTPVAAQYTHPHNELLYSMSEMGILGLIGTILLYLFPWRYFWRHRASDDSGVREASISGLVVISGYVIYGLADCMFTNSMNTAFYVLCLTTLYAQIEHTRKYKAKLCQPNW